LRCDARQCYHPIESMQSDRKLGAVVLAAGQGKRMQLADSNKVTLPLANKPIILHIVHFMKKLAIETIVIVVGFAKDSVMEVLSGEKVIFAEQKERLGTGHAVERALEVLPHDITDVLVVYGDDAVFYIDNHLPIIDNLFTKHFSSGTGCSLLTITLDDPKGMGRIIRDSDGKIQAIAEEKDATEQQRKINEINIGCFVFQVDFLKKYLPKVERSAVTGEYYLTSLIDLALRHGEQIASLEGGKLPWRGVNTADELEEAEKIYSQVKD
jgi:bifunctional UDP-N-acetylglucosamine pyrophosphorylase / glucosamine-1-phosphate N-acetyltransferase